MSPDISKMIADSLIRRGDQAVVAIVLLTALAAMIGWRTFHVNRVGRLVEADRAEKIEYSFTVDINTADWPELAQLPGIGEITARKIVVSRKKEGPFAGHDDLCRVRGIGGKTVARMRPFLRSVENGGG